jgi:hypothetical protein
MLNSMKRMTGRFAMVGIVALSLVTMSTAVRANCLAYIGRSEDGSTDLYLTCGSSAGAGFWECPVAGGPCNGFTDPSADFLCATGFLGCPPYESKLLRKCDIVPTTTERKPGEITSASGYLAGAPSSTR